MKRNSQEFLKSDAAYSENKITAAELDEKNCVDVRVWYSKMRSAASGMGNIGQWQKANIVSALFHNMQDVDSSNIGHVTIQTPNAYASMWPKTNNMNSPIEEYKAEFNTLPNDEYSEDGKCDVLVRLYSLKVKAIEDAFKEVRATNVGYVLLAGTSVAPKKGQNCCTLTYLLLREGGIENLDLTESSTMKVFKTPNEFAEYICSAKDSELKKYPSTAFFERAENEYYPTAKQKKDCSIL